MYEGSSIKRKVGVLKKDANSIAHLLTHRYRNPFCESCVKAKMRHFRSRTGAFKREVKTFGDLVTFDFVAASGDHEVEGRYALIIRDIYTGIIMAYPTARRDTDSVVRAIKHFCGRRKIKQVYSDDGPELINACVELKLNHDLSLPGRPQNNSLAERTNQFIIDQTSACLVHAGLPTCYWVQAITTLCHLMNIEEVNGSSAWMRLHGEEFKGEKIPFGALGTERGNWYICWVCVEHRYALGKQASVSCLGTYCICGCRAEHQEGEGSTSVENATSDGEDDSEISSDIPNTAEVQGCQRDFGRDRDVHRCNRSGCTRPSDRR